MSEKNKGEQAGVLNFHGRGVRVSLGVDCWGTWAKVRWLKARLAGRKICFQLVTGGEYSSIVFEETFEVDSNSCQRGTLIRFPAGFTWEMLERLYVVVKPIKE